MTITQAVLFDAADTLFTTRGSVGEIYGCVAREYGCTASFADIQAAFVRQFRHSGPLSTTNEKAWWRDVVFRVFGEVGLVPDFDGFFDKVYDQFRDSRGWMLFPETIEVLSCLKEREVRLGVISNFDSRVYSVMGDLGIREFFDAVTISSEAGFAKPDSRIFAAAVRALACPAEAILVVGDSLHDDVVAAARAGLRAVLVDRANRHHGAGVPRIASLKEVLAVVFGPPPAAPRSR
jgi:putative hydrolase of the HAD superfamily